MSSRAVECFGMLSRCCCLYLIESPFCLFRNNQSSHLYNHFPLLLVSTWLLVMTKFTFLSSFISSQCLHFTAFYPSTFSQYSREDLARCAKWICFNPQCFLEKSECLIHLILLIISFCFAFTFKNILNEIMSAEVIYTFVNVFFHFCMLSYSCLNPIAVWLHLEYFLNISSIIFPFLVLVALATDKWSYLDLFLRKISY